jgi:hypothetical protein
LDRSDVLTLRAERMSDSSRPQRLFSMYLGAPSGDKLSI